MINLNSGLAATGKKLQITQTNTQLTCMLSNCGRMSELKGFGVSQLKYKFIILSLLCCGFCLFFKVTSNQLCL